MVTREIKPYHGHVLVEDKIHLPISAWAVSPRLQNILKEKQQGGTNILNCIKNLLGEEDLDVVGYDAIIKDKFMDVRITSKVRMVVNKPARIHCLATYGGYQYTVSVSGKLSEPYMLIYFGTSGSLLWMPEWDAPDDLAATVAGFINVRRIKRQVIKDMTDNLQLRCFLKRGADEETLFEARPRAAAQNAPGQEFLSRVHESHRMSGNDWHRLFTDVRPAKPGYYVVDADWVTNNPHFLTHQVQQMTPTQLNALVNEFHGNSTRVFPETKFVIDGSMRDWANCKTAWLSNIAFKPQKSDRSYNVTACYYSNDTNYLYLFLKVQPSVQQKFIEFNPDGKLRSLGNIGFFFLCNKSDKASGAQRRSERLEFSVGDLMVSILAGTHMSTMGAAPEVSYHICEWDPHRKSFGEDVQSQSSASEFRLINYGVDGVEIAIPLEDIKKSNGDTCEFYFVGSDGLSQQQSIKITIE
jgi:hypothetical protein